MNCRLYDVECTSGEQSGTLSVGSDRETRARSTSASTTTEKRRAASPTEASSLRIGSVTETTTMHPLPQQDWQTQHSVAGTDPDRNPDEQIFGESNGGSGLTRAAWGLDFSMLFEMPQPVSVDMSALPQLDAAFLSTVDSSLDGHLWHGEQQSSFRNLPNSMGGAVSTIQLVTPVYGKSLASQLSPGLGAFVCADQKVVNYTGTMPGCRCSNDVFD